MHAAAAAGKDKKKAAPLKKCGAANDKTPKFFLIAIEKKNRRLNLLISDPKMKMRGFQRFFFMSVYGLQRYGPGNDAGREQGGGERVWEDGNNLKWVRPGW